MVKQVNKVISNILLLALSINFALYSSQSYSLPKAESVSYSIVNCPSHDGGHHALNIVQAILGSDSENGAEKDCFCYDCCTQRVSPFIATKTITTNLARYSYYAFKNNESSFTEDSYINLPIRSPPASIII